MNKTKEKTIIVVGTVASGIALKLLRDSVSALLERYPERYLKDSERILREGIVSKEFLRKVLSEEQEDFLFSSDNGGIYGAFWKLGERLGTGLRLWGADIPISQPAIEICDYLGINPFDAESPGCFATAFVDAGTSLLKLKEAGIPARAVGYTTQENARVILGNTNRFLTP